MRPCQWGIAAKRRHEPRAVWYSMVRAHRLPQDTIFLLRGWRTARSRQATSLSHCRQSWRFILDADCAHAVRRGRNGGLVVDTGRCRRYSSRRASPFPARPTGNPAQCASCSRCCCSAALGAYTTRQISASKRRRVFACRKLRLDSNSTTLGAAARISSTSVVSMHAPTCHVQSKVEAEETCPSWEKSTSQ